MRVNQNDLPRLVYKENAARRRFHGQAEFLLSSLLLRHIDRDTPQEEIFAVRSSHAAGAVFRPAYTAVDKYNPILEVVILPSSGRILQRLPDSIAIIDMHSGKGVFQLDVSRSQSQES